MLERTRKILLILALAAMGLAFLAELGSPLVGRATLPGGPPAGSAADVLGRPLTADEQRVQAGLVAKSGGEQPPGIGIAYLALLDALLAYSALQIGLVLVLPERAVGKLLGVGTLLVSLVVLVLGIFLVFVAIAKLLLMIGLLLAVPFGTIAYLVLFGFFAKGRAAAVLSLAMGLKVAFAVLLVVAQERFLTNKGLMFLIATSLLAAVILGFLHGVVPTMLVSITDAVGAIVNAVLAVIWAVILLVRSIPAVIKALRVDRALA